MCIRTLLLAAVTVAVGCRDHPGTSTTEVVTVSELGEATDHLVCFNYIGSDSNFHYFTTAEKKRYKVSLSEWTPAKTLSLDDGIQVFMTVKDGRLTVPDPKELAGLSHEELLHRPYRKQQQ